MQENLKDSVLEKVTGGLGEGSEKITVNFVGDYLTVTCEKPVDRFHITINNLSRHGLPSDGYSHTFDRARRENPCSYSIKAVYSDGSKRTISFENPSDPFVCEY